MNSAAPCVTAGCIKGDTLESVLYCYEFQFSISLEWIMRKIRLLLMYGLPTRIHN